MTQVDIGDLGAVLFLRVEHHDNGVSQAIFATEDGATFGLDGEALCLRIEFLEQQGRDSWEERRARQALV